MIISATLSFIEERSHNFFIFSHFQTFTVLQCGILSMIDTPFQLCPLYRNVTKFLYILSFSKLFGMTVWKNVDDKYSIPTLSSI